MKNFFLMIGSRIKKLIATILSVPFMLLMITIYAEFPKELIFTIVITLLTKRQIDKIRGLGYFGKDK